MGSYSEPYVVPDLYHSQVTKPIKVVCIGAGLSGLCLAYKMIKGLESFDLTIYEKDADIGGTWLENRYPGCACDVPAHIYTFTFDPKTDWSEYYAGAKEIHKYCKDFYEKHCIARFVKLGHRVRKAEWDEISSKWKVEVDDLTSTTAQPIHDACDVLIDSSGFLNTWSWPKIDGFENFKLPKVHSAHWDDGIDFRGKRVGIIGNGSSAIQIVPKIAREASLLNVFMRSPTWISPALGGSVALKFQDEMSHSEAAGSNANKHEQFTFSEEEKKRFRDDPKYHLMFRKKIEAEFNTLADMFVMGSDTQKQVQQMMIKQMETRLGPGNEELKAKLIPTWAPGCRRLTPGDGYLETLIQPHIKPVFGEIGRLTRTAVEMVDGSQYEVDVLVCATGFDTSFIRPFPIVGRNGLTMAEAWKNKPDAYLGIAAPNFPNYFMTTGPQGPLGNGTILPAIETACEYLVTVMRKMQEEKIKTLEPKRWITTKFQEHMSIFHKGSVWSQPCRSWYKNGAIDGDPQLWCGSALTYVKTIKAPRFEHYEIDYESVNPWAFLGNGKVKAHYDIVDGKPKYEGLAPYIRSDDAPWEI